LPTPNTQFVPTRRALVVPAGEVIPEELLGVQTSALAVESTSGPTSVPRSVPEQAAPT
jgi:hypothetical protein